MPETIVIPKGNTNKSVAFYTKSEIDNIFARFTRVSERNTLSGGDGLDVGSADARYVRINSDARLRSLGVGMAPSDIEGQIDAAGNIVAYSNGGGAASVSDVYTVGEINVEDVLRVPNYDGSVGTESLFDGNNEIFSKFIPSGAGGGAAELNDLTDVSNVTPATDQVLVFDGSVYGNAKLEFSQLVGLIADGQVPQSVVTQHEGALTITPAQVGLTNGSADLDLNTLSISGNWKLDSEAEGGVERLRLQAIGANDPAELFLQAKGSANAARITVTPSSSSTNFSGLTMESNGTNHSIESTIDGSASLLPIKVRMGAADAITVDTLADVEIHNGLTGTTGTFTSTLTGVDAYFTSTVTSEDNIIAYSSGGGAPSASGIYTVDELTANDNINVEDPDNAGVNIALFDPTTRQIKDAFIPTGAGGGAGELNDLSDVSVSGPVDDQVLVFSTGVFGNAQLNFNQLTGAGSYGVSNFNNDAGYITSYPVDSVFGRTGAVTAQSGDYSFSQISGTLTDGQLPQTMTGKTFSGLTTHQGGIDVTGGILDVRVSGAPTATPNTYLRVGDSTGSSRVGIIANSTAAGILEFGDENDADVGAIQYRHSDNSFGFRVNAAQDVAVLSTTGLGIGKSPTEALDVNGNIMLSGISKASNHSEGASDPRLKSKYKVLDPLHIARYAILLSYDKEGRETREIGLRSDHMRKANPLLVGSMHHKKYNSVETLSSYSLASVALAGVGVLDREFEVYKTRTERLEDRVENLEQENRELRQKLREVQHGLAA